MIFFLIWILVNIVLVCASGGCGGCGRPFADKGSYHSNGYPSWFPSSGYDRTNQGYSAMNQYPSTHEHHHPPSTGYSSASGYQPPVDGNYYVADKGYQGYPANNGDQNGFYDTGFKGYHNTWSDKGSAQYPGMNSGQYSGMNSGQYPGLTSGNGRIDYLDDDRIDTYARRGYKGDPGYSNSYYRINRVKKQSAQPTAKKTT
ncbi:uncharacterized protein [Halyomorpha halys]|uniref:uncharacterized protein n=1 Tax=Halyomorpha halys TaxID=286706 RepID=UPI0006D4EE30|nr:uncharacterized protein LOC106686656 [Halyomorpha halys]